LKRTIRHVFGKLRLGLGKAGIRKSEGCWLKGSGGSGGSGGTLEKRVCVLKLWFRSNCSPSSNSLAGPIALCVVKVFRGSV